MSSVMIRRVVCGVLDNNTYIIHAEGQTDCVVIDPADTGEEIVSTLRAEGLTCGLILLTHGHFDHITGVETVKNAFGAKVGISAKDAYMLEHPKTMFDIFRRYTVNPVKPDMLLRDGDTIDHAGVCITVMTTPGHSRGSVCYICGGVIFSGDTMFYRSSGRTDFEESSSQAIAQSFQKLYALSGNYTVYPGHGAETTLDDERRHNLFMKG